MIERDETLTHLTCLIRFPTTHTNTHNKTKRKTDCDVIIARTGQKKVLDKRR